MIVPKFVSGYGYLEHFIPLASRLISIKYVADTLKSEQEVLFLQPNMNLSNSTPIVSTF